MSYTSITFLIFIIIVGIVYFVIPKKCRWAVLLAGSCVFYYASSGWLIVFMAVSALSVYFSGRAITAVNDKFEAQKSGLTKEARKKLKASFEKQKRAVIIVTLLVNFGMLFFLKYFNFIDYIFSSFHASIKILKPNWLMPLGISYYTLQSVSYMIDIYRGKITAERNFGKLALFVSFFPQIVEGPIGRYDKLAETLYEGHSFDYTRVKLGCQLILWGFFKKLVIADRAAFLVNTVFTSYTKYSGLTIAVAVLLYTLQIYAEFSGCMDIVTGVAQIYGVRLDSNFRQPFFSKTVAEFWRRWHITLGAWLRDYIFYPVSMSKWYRQFSKKAREKLNDHLANLIPMMGALFFVWVGMGIWHGASFKYVFYGLYYYFFMMLGEAIKPLAEGATAKLRIHKESRLFKLFQMARTFIVIYFGMLIFRSHSVTTAAKLFKSIFTGFSLKTIADGSLLKLGLRGSDFILLFVSFIIMVVVGILHEKGFNLREQINRRPLIIRWSLYFAAIFSIIILGIYGGNYNVGTFIYGNF